MGNQVNDVQQSDNVIEDNNQVGQNDTAMEIWINYGLLNK